ncbi:hypothetical protein GOODEAATRI_005085 [Goodea atripinnis]|uniref:Uncharacterized protein n=1 Tax=Goodea atripinnis TaxID=208336 RepID=A0ABV0PVG3_9TELE
METTQELLDLICLYCDKNPVQEGAPQVEDAEEAGEETKRRKPKWRRAADHLRTSWKENNNAERIFNLLPEKDSRCYSALIRGMELLNQMNEQKVRPNLLTFNSVLKALRRCGFLAKTYAPQTLNEMKALGIDIKTLGHDNKVDLVEELLSLMAREEHSPEVQESFSACALDVKSAFDGRSSMEWSTSSLSHVTTLLLRANKLQQAW